MSNENNVNVVKVYSGLGLTVGNVLKDEYNRYRDEFMTIKMFIGNGYKSDNGGI